MSTHLTARDTDRLICCAGQGHTLEYSLPKPSGDGRVLDMVKVDDRGACVMDHTLLLDHLERVTCIDIGDEWLCRSGSVR